MTQEIRIVELDGAAAKRRIDDLARVLVDCVAGGASVSFMSPFGLDDGHAFFARVAESVAAGDVRLLAAFVADRLVGTVQLGLDLPPNQDHRGDVRKLLVHREARRLGIARALMARVEDVAREAGRSVLVLDTVTGGDAERLYGAVGWVRVGSIPDYAKFPDGRLCGTTVFYKHLVPLATPLATVDGGDAAAAA